MTASSIQPLAGLRPWRLRHGLGLLLVILVGVGLGWGGRSREIRILGDEPVYISLSQSLAAGHYRDESLVGTPPHAQYPPGMPLWLLSVRTAFGPDLDMARAANLLLLAVTMLLVADLVRRISSPWVGVAAGALTLLNPWIVQRAGTLYAETLFMSLVAIAIWSAHRADEARLRRWTLLAVASGLGAFLTRVAGVAPLLGLITWLLVRRRWGQAVALGVTAAVTVGAWAAYAGRAAAGSIGRSYASDVAAMSPTNFEQIRRVLSSLKSYVTGVVPIALGVPTIAGTIWDNAVAMLVLGSLGVLGMVVVLRRSTATGLIIIAYGGMLALWLYPNARFLIPILPWVIAVLAVGAHQVGLRLPSRFSLAPLVGLVGVLGLPAIRIGLTRSTLGSECTAARTGDPTACYPKEHRGYVHASIYARDSLPQDAVIVGGKPALIFLLTGRHALPAYLARLPDGSPSLESLLALGATHFLVGPARGRPVDDTDEEEHKQPYFQVLCEQLTTMASFPGTILLARRTDPSRQPGACAEVANYLRIQP